MLVTEALSNQADPVAGDERSVAKAVATAEQMASDGADSDAVMEFLVNAGAPPEQAHQLVEQMMARTQDAAAPKKRFSLRRNKKD